LIRILSLRGANDHQSNDAYRQRKPKPLEAIRCPLLDAYCVQEKVLKLVHFSVLFFSIHFLPVKQA
jgi:hypothetical protein